MATIKGTGVNEKGLRSDFFEALNTADVVWQRLAKTIKSTADRETYFALGHLPRVREWGTGRLAVGLFKERYEVENLEYELTLDVDRKEWEDDQTGQIHDRMQELGKAAAVHKDFLVEQLLENGETGEAHDGKKFFAADHEAGLSGAQSNILSMAVADDDVNIFTAAEGKTALRLAIARLMGFKNDQGNNAYVRPSGLVLLSNPSMQFTWKEVVGAAMIGSTSNVDVGAAEVVPMNGLTTSGVTYICKADESQKPFIFQDREPTDFDVLGPGSEHTFNTGMIRAGTRARYRMAYGRWMYAVKITFTT